jgi:hypothetical protein
VEPLEQRPVQAVGGDDQVGEAGGDLILAVPVLRELAVRLVVLRPRR